MPLNDLDNQQETVDEIEIFNNQLSNNERYKRNLNEKNSGDDHLNDESKPKSDKIINPNVNDDLENNLNEDSEKVVSSDSKDIYRKDIANISLSNIMDVINDDDSNTNFNSFNDVIEIFDKDDLESELTNRNGHSRNFKSEIHVVDVDKRDLEDVDTRDVDDGLVRKIRQINAEEFTSVRAETIIVALEGIRIEESDKDPKIENGVPSVLAETSVTLRLVFNSSWFLPFFVGLEQDKLIIPAMGIA